MAEHRFDWHPKLEIAELQAHAEVIRDDVLSSYTSKRGASAKTRTAALDEIANHLICALYCGQTEPFNASPVSIPLRSVSYHATAPGKVHYSYVYTSRLYQALLKRHWISIVAKPHTGKHTRIEPAGELLDTCEELGLRWAPQALRPREELVELRDVKRNKSGKAVRKSGKTEKITLSVPSSPLIAQWQSNVYEINTLISRHLVSLDLSDKNLKSLVDGMTAGTVTSNPRHLRLHDVQLTRIFSRGRMDLGGRFYRGWWQAIPEKHRPHITINEKLTIEVDYSAIGMRIIYGMLGKSYSAAIDPYDIDLPKWDGTKDARRPAVKRVINALINDMDSVFRFSEKDEQELGIDEVGFRKLFEGKHPDIYNELGTDIGLRAQFIDSQVAEAIMLDLLRDNIPVLPIHDSFIVTAGNEQILKDTMLSRFEEIAGIGADVESGIVKLNEHFAVEGEDLQQLADTTHEQVVCGTDITLDEILDEERRQSLSGRFSRGWLEHSINCRS
jgi:hypothetical protein